MRLGILMKSTDDYVGAFRFMKLFKEGIEDTNASSLPSKEEIVRSFNNYVGETFLILETALLGGGRSQGSHEIETKDIYIGQEIDDFFEEHTIHLSDRSYVFADQRFMFFDSERDILKLF